MQYSQLKPINETASICGGEKTHLLGSNMEFSVYQSELKLNSRAKLSDAITAAKSLQCLPLSSSWTEHGLPKLMITHHIANSVYYLALSSNK